MELPRLEDIELTLEDILNIHRYWITSLFVEEGKTSSEIVKILHEHGLQATPLQVRTAIRNWKLISSNTPPKALRLPDLVAAQKDIHNTLSRPGSASVNSDRSFSSNASHLPSDPDIAVLYTFKPLPPLPDVKHNDSKVRKQRSLVNDRIRLTCHHGPLPGDIHEVQTRLDSIPRAGTGLGMTPLEMYMGAEQNHERFAIGLERDLHSFVAYRRAGDLREQGKISKPRIRKTAHFPNLKRDGGTEGQQEKIKTEEENERHSDTEDELS